MSNLVIPDGGNIGSASDPDAISIASSGKPTFSQGIADTGTIDAGTLGSSVVVPASIGGSMHLIQKQTASNDSLIEFTNLSNHSAFTNLYFIFNGIKPTNDNVTFRSRIAETGTTYISASYNHIAFYIERNFGTNNTAGPALTGSTTTQFITMGNLGNHATDDLGLSGYAMVYHPFATDKFKRTEFTLCYGTYVQNDVRVAGHCSYGGANSAKKSATFSAIKFEMSSGTIASGSITMYGIKDA